MLVNGNEDNPYFRTKEYNITRGAYKFSILWNAEEIGGLGCSGYIVQLVDINSNIKGIRVAKLPYYEAWKVDFGIISKGDCDYDDCFECWCVDNKGTISYDSKVYWIGVEDSLYSIVDGWKPRTVIMANELPSSFEFPGIEKKSPVFSRRFLYDNRGM